MDINENIGREKSFSGSDYTGNDNMYAVFFDDIEVTSFGHFATSEDAMCAIMMSGAAGYVLQRYSVKSLD